jgi:hypothetical protein
LTKRLYALHQAIVAAMNAGRTMLDQLPLFSSYSSIYRLTDIANPDTVFANERLWHQVFSVNPESRMSSLVS